MARALVGGAFASLLLLTAPPARAQSSIGFTGGGSIDPGQAYAGVFFQSPEVANRFRFRAGLDGGFGNDLRLGTVNVDFLYYFPVSSGNWAIVTGGGPVVVLVRQAHDVFNVGTEVHAGGGYVFGFAHEGGFFTEFRLGSGWAPALKFGAGWSIKLK